MGSRGSLVESSLGAFKYFQSQFFHVFENCFGPPHAGELKFEHIPRAVSRAVCSTLGPERVGRWMPKKWKLLRNRKVEGMTIGEWFPLQFANFSTWPRDVASVRFPPPPKEVGTAKCRVTYCGHSGVLIQTEESNFMIDALFGSRSGCRYTLGPVELLSSGVKRVTPAPIPLEDLETFKIHAFLVSHDHPDNFDKAGIKSLLNWSGPTLCAGRGMSRHVFRKDGPSTYFMDWYDTIKYDLVKIQFLPAVHSSGRGFFIDRNNVLWGSWLIASECFTIFHAGGTGYSEHFGLIAENVRNLDRKIDLAILPIGGYEVGAMKNIYMTPEEAVKAFKDLGAKKAIAIHHDTLPVGVEGYGHAKRDLLEALLRENISPADFFVMEPGQHHYISTEVEEKDSVLGRVEDTGEWANVVAWENETAKTFSVKL